jgi:formyl-CoA transferase
VCAALYVREKTGKGQRVDTTLLGTALGLQTSSFMEVAAFDGEPRREFLAVLEAMRESGASYEEIDAQHKSALSPWRRGNVYYRTYQARDGVLAVACLSDRLRKRVADILGIDDPRFQPGYDVLSDEAADSSERLAKVAEGLFRERTVADWLEVFDGAGVPAGPVRYVQELLDDEQVAANDLVVELEHSVAGNVRMVGPIINMSETPLSVQGPSPALGEHTDEILMSIGMDEDAIQRLKDEGVTR